MSMSKQECRMSNKIAVEAAYCCNDFARLKFYNVADTLSRGEILISMKAKYLEYWQYKYLLNRLRGA